MSSRELVLTDQAERDFRSIVRYTSKEWGEEQSSRYEMQLTEAMQRIAQFPSAGAPRFDLGEAVRVRVAGQHIIVYQTNDDLVLILRLLHKRMNAIGHVEIETHDQ